MKKTVLLALSVSLLLMPGASFSASDKWSEYEPAINRVAEELGMPRYDDLPALEMRLGKERGGESFSDASVLPELRKSPVPEPPEPERTRPAAKEKKGFFARLLDGIKTFFSKLFGIFSGKEERPSVLSGPERREKLADELRKVFNQYKMEVLHNGFSEKARKLLKKYARLCEEYGRTALSPASGEEPEYLREELSAGGHCAELGGVKNKLRKAFSGKKISLDDIALNFRETDGNFLSPLADRKNFWPALIRDIENAETSVNIHIFGMQADKWGWEFARLLAGKSAQGVKVRILADIGGARMAWYNHRASRELFEYYRKNGVEFVFYKASFNPFNGEKFLHFDHRKYFIIDGRVAYNTGYTLENHMKEEMFDIAVRAEGPIVSQMQASFFLNYFANGGKVAQKDFDEFYAMYFPAPRPAGDMKAKLAINVPTRQHRVTESYYERISGARKSVYVVNPYFTDDRIVDSLMRAKENGADVHVILPYNPENPLNSRNSTYHAWQLVRKGVKVHLFLGPEKFGRLHAKGILVDGDFASIGSCNMDKMALYQNYEQNIESGDPYFAALVKKRIFDYAIRYSTPFKMPHGFGETAPIVINGAISGIFDFID